MTVAIHTTITWLVLVTNAVAGLWATAAHWLRPTRSRWLWRTTIVAQALVVVYVISGALLAKSGEVDDFFFLYDFSAIVTVVCLFAWREAMWHRLYLMYGLGGLFISGLAIRTLFLL